MSAVAKFTANGQSQDPKLDAFSDPKKGADRLASIPLFKCFTPQELITIYKCGHVIQLNTGAHAVIEGESTRGLYLILSGSMSVFKTDAVANSLHRIARMGEGKYFGEISLFDKAPRTATVSADVPSYLFSLDFSQFEAFLSKEGEAVKARFYKACAEDLSSRFRVLNNDYINAQQILWKYALRRKDELE